MILLSIAALLALVSGALLVARLCVRLRMDQDATELLHGLLILMLFVLLARQPKLPAEVPVLALLACALLGGALVGWFRAAMPDHRSPWAPSGIAAFMIIVTCGTRLGLIHTGLLPSSFAGVALTDAGLVFGIGAIAAFRLQGALESA